ncbi:hypothetical protein [Kitasatospora sp. NPDC088783]|uniref:hypothetical protein n=1 Tax=Kitasatospora sp. NPDC088783 TaxID=3364077 RepID=UPI00382F013F
MERANRLPEDPTELEQLLMRGASTVRQVEAAERLVLRVPQLRAWLIERGFLAVRRQGDFVYASTYFEEAVDAAVEILRGGHQALADTGLTMSGFSVLGVAANLSGQVQNSLRYAAHTIDDDDAKLVAEAVLYALGYMDATVDVHGNEVDGWGPNSLAYEERLENL